MEPIIPWWWIYLISVGHSMGVFLLLAALLSGFGAAMAGMAWVLFDECQHQAQMLLNAAKRLAAVALASGLAAALIPDRQTMYLMLVNSFITPDNLEWFADGAMGLIDYIFEQIRGLP